MSLSIVGARVWDSDGDLDLPAVRDLHITDGVIVAEPPPQAEIVDATGMLALPGFVNAHHHSYDVLAKGLLERMPFDVWALHSQPAYFGRRPAAELRARTLLSGLECLRSGITTIQDMCSLVPFDEQTLDIILDAYAELGIRVVFSVAVRDVAALDIAAYLTDLPTETLAWVQGRATPAAEQLAFVQAQLKRRPATGLRSWALSPSGPQRCSDELLDGIAALSQDDNLPVFTHVYETRVQTARARDLYRASGGSMIRHLADRGLLSDRTNLVHAVWITPAELELVAGAGSAIVHNPVSNMKLRSGIAPIAAAQRAGVPIALGCDNCSCGDTHNMFQAMKAMCLLTGLREPLPDGIDAAAAMRAATSEGAGAIGRPDLGALQVGQRADITLIKLDDLAYVPLNSATRQVVFGESGRAVQTVVVDGRVVLRDGVATTIDEAALQAEVAELMVGFRRDFAGVVERARPAVQPLLAALALVNERDVGVSAQLTSGR
ncbi:amidohydrolase family protein [Jatrophihabitans sp. GAS493]|uniref:amidohydrolase family protein n=1 Tax=Jatrophihabitans sp. GAS493 TaxID=1907575 RepID=UPI000BB90D6E|nr:amidohydrolase family protein [Jatrophihabitans sp. GAS493]